jgi:hypothetical protein
MYKTNNTYVISKEFLNDSTLVERTILHFAATHLFRWMTDLTTENRPLFTGLSIIHRQQLLPAEFSSHHKPPPKLSYVDGTFVVWSYVPEQLQSSLSHYNSIRPTIQFTTEIKSGSAVIS